MFPPFVPSAATHKVHDCIDFIVTVQDIHEKLVQVGHVRDREVFGITDPLGKVAEDVGSGKYVFLSEILGPKGHTAA